MRSVASYLVLFSVFCLLASPVRAQTNDSLLTVHPNPFGASTELTLHDLQEDTINLKIYNFRQEQLVEYFDDLVLSGTLTVLFEADTLNASVYFALLVKNGASFTKKLIKISTTDFNTPVSPPSIRLSPNPTDGPLQIEGADRRMYEAKIFNSSGQLLLQTEQNEELDLSGLKSGIYFVQLRSLESGKSVMKRIVVE